MSEHVSPWTPTTLAAPALDQVLALVEHARTATGQCSTSVALAVGARCHFIAADLVDAGAVADADLFSIPPAEIEYTPQALLAAAATKLDELVASGLPSDWSPGLLIAVADIAAARFSLEG